MADGRDMQIWTHTSTLAAMTLNGRGLGFKWIEPKMLNPYTQSATPPKPQAGNISELRGLCRAKRT